MEIVNRHLINGAWPAKAVYVGRGTPLGNPCVIGEHGDRDEVIDQYAAWLDWQIQTRNPVVLTALAGLREDSILQRGSPCTTLVLALAIRRLQ